MVRITGCIVDGSRQGHRYLVPCLFVHYPTAGHTNKYRQSGIWGYEIQEALFFSRCAGALPNPCGQMKFID